MSANGPSGWKDRLRGWADSERLHQHEDKVLLVLTLVIGAVVGLVIASFILLTENLGARMYPGDGAAWRRFLIPILGSLVTGILLVRYFPLARGSGIPQTKTALFIHDGFIRLRTVVGKYSLSSIALASGLSLGREGPSVQIGAGLASVLGRQLGLGPRQIKALVPVGAAAALAAAFNTPVAAVLFTLEEVMGDLHAPVLGSIVLSSATSWIVLHLVLGDEPLFHVPAYQLVHPLEFIAYAALGVIGGLVSVGFVKLLLWQRKHFLKMPAWTRAWQPVAGGLVVGLIGWFVPEVLGVGYGHVSEALNGQLALRVMMLLVVLKLVATATCYASGNAGGIFGPSLFIGAMMGGAVGSTAHSLLPDYTGSAGAYALVGMGAAFAGIIRVPLTSVIMIFEVTRDYSIIVPLMISNLMSYFISSRLQREPIYEALQHQDGIHLPASGKYRGELLEVKDALKQPIAPFGANETPTDALKRLDMQLNAGPVMGEAGLSGMVTRRQLELAIAEGRASETLGTILRRSHVGGELTAEKFPHVHADQPLDAALQRMADAQMNVLPVVSRANVRELKGIVSLPDILDTYGVGEGRRARLAAEVREGGSPRLLLPAVLAATLAVFVLIGVLTYTYRSERSTRARLDFQAGNALLQQDRLEEAIACFRNALSISRENGEYRLALGLALVKTKHFSEAELYLRQLLKADPDNGAANLGMARIAVAGNEVPQAIAFYRRASYGAWPSGSDGERLRARFEMAEFLGRHGSRNQAVLEISSLLEQAAGNPEAQKHAGQLLLEFGSPQQASAVFSGVVRKNERDAGAHAALGQSEFSLGKYALAERAYRDAVRLDPQNQVTRQRLDVCEKILALDTALRGLNSRDRYGRSRQLLDRVLSNLQPCLAEPGKAAVSGSVYELAAKGRALLAQRPRSGFSDAADSLISVSEELWTARAGICGAAIPVDEPLDRVIDALSK